MLFSTFFQRLCVAAILLTFVIGGCDSPLNHTSNRPIPKTGKTPLPTQDSFYKDKTNAKNKLTKAQSNVPTVDWDEIKALLKKVRQQTDRHYSRQQASQR